MSAQSKADGGNIIFNKRARFEYFIEEEFEAGLCLEGWEVKSLRAGKVNITDAHVIMKQGEAWLLGSLIQPLPTAATHTFPDPTRTRKLLLSRRELSKLIGLIERQGYTLVPLSMYWKRNKIKLKIALAKGKKMHDKRETTKERDWQRDKARILKQSK